MSAPTSRYRLRLSVWLAMSPALLTGCGLSGQPNPADRPVPADQVMEFAQLFGENCAGCHGKNGKLGPAPPLNDPLFRAIVPEEELENIISRGRPRTLMPAFAKDNGGTLTAAQIQVLVKEIKGARYMVIANPDTGVRKVEPMSDAGGLSLKWGMPQKLPKGAPSYREPLASSNGGVTGDKEKGAAVFARACAVCHGNQGQGSEMASAINDRVFLALVSNQALRRYVITGLPERGMPGFADARPDEPNFVPLADREVTDLVALLASWRGDK